MTSDEILDILETMFPQARCELNYRNGYELAVAVILSAQTTDIAVNNVTPSLFEAYPTPELMSQARPQEIEPYIRKIGLFRNKAKNLVAFSQMLVQQFQSTVPNTLNDLIKLPGVGRKTANVILSELYQIPAIAVDTHVERVSKRLRLAKPYYDVFAVEKALMRKIKKERWNKAHHLFIFFGRYQCKARSPMCEGCPFMSFCTYQKNIKDKEGK